MKYLIIRDAHGVEFPVFCVAPQTHAEMATAWRRSDSNRVVAGGFVELLPACVRVFGHSTSLALYPRPQDAQLIAAFYRATLALGESQQPSILSHAADVALHRTA